METDSLDRSDLIRLVGEYKVQIERLQNELSERDQIISKLQAKLSGMKNQMQVQQGLLEAELKKTETTTTSELTSNLVKEVELDDMTQNWLATEFTSPANIIIEEEAEGGDGDESQIAEESQEGDAREESPLDAIQESNEEPTTEPNTNRDISSLPSRSSKIDIAGEDKQTSEISISIAPTISVSDQDLQKELSPSKGQDERTSRLGVLKQVRRASQFVSSTSKMRIKRLSLSFASEVIPSVPAGVIDQLRSPDFTMSTKSHDELKKCVLYMIMDLQLVETFMIRPTTIKNFLDHLEIGYKSNPYHNFRHAIDVTQTVYYYLIKTNARDILHPIDILALIISSLSHDVGHPGQNNAFQINTQSELARIYNDTSVLESYHAAKTFEIIRLYEYPKDDIEKDPTHLVRYFSQKTSGDFDHNPKNTNVFLSLTNSQFKEIRKNMINMILFTDMSKHFDMTAKLSGLAKLAETDATFLSSERREDREFLCSVLLHCADISNVTKKFDISKYWADCLRDEFHQQGDMEKMYGLPVSPYMDREDSNQARTTLNFIDFVATPLFSSLSIILRGLEEVSSTLMQNRQQWQDVLELQLSEPAGGQPNQATLTGEKKDAPQIQISNPVSISISEPNSNVTVNPATTAESSSIEAQKAAQNKAQPKLLDTREFEKQAYRRRSVIVMQKVNEADEAAKRISTRGGLPKPLEPNLLPVSPLITIMAGKLDSVNEVEESGPTITIPVISREKQHSNNSPKASEHAESIAIHVPGVRVSTEVPPEVNLHQESHHLGSSEQHKESNGQAPLTTSSAMSISHNQNPFPLMPKKGIEPAPFASAKPGFSGSMVNNVGNKGHKSLGNAGPIGAPSLGGNSGHGRRMDRAGLVTNAPSSFDGTVVNSSSLHAGVSASAPISLTGSSKNRNNKHKETDNPFPDREQQISAYGGSSSSSQNSHTAGSRKHNDKSDDVGGLNGVTLPPLRNVQVRRSGHNSMY